MTERLTIALVSLALFVLVAVLPVAALSYITAPGINQTATVYIGEEGLNLTHALNKANYSSTSNPSLYAGDDAKINMTNAVIGWWATGATVAGTAPSAPTVDLSNGYASDGSFSSGFLVAPSTFVGYTGNWYLINKVTGLSYSPAVPVFTVADPQLSIGVWDFDQSVDVTGNSVTQGEHLGFKVGTNMQSVYTNRYPVYTTMGVTKSNDPFPNNNSGDGYVDIKVMPASGTTLTALYNDSGMTAPLVEQNITLASWTWGALPQFNWTGTAASSNVWGTGNIDTTNGQNRYPAGTYTVYAESDLNNMKANYQNGGASYTGKTISSTVTIALVSNTVKLDANMDTVVRSKPFSVTITGKPSAYYYLWVKDTWGSDNSVNDQAPMIGPNQLGVNVSDPLAANYTFLNSQLTLAGDTESDYPADANGNTALGFANVSLSSSGTRTIQFLTTNWTSAQDYIIRVENAPVTVNGVMYDKADANVKSDEVTVTVNQGAVTVVAAGDQSYYLGEQVKLSGTNTESFTTYLFMVGPNLPLTGGELSNPQVSVAPAVAGSTASNGFTEQATVNGDNTWSYTWGTAGIQLDAGTYTIYAESQPILATDTTGLGNEAFGTVSIIIKKPFVSATASSAVVAEGDNMFVTGTAEGNPTPGVAIWILGKNYAVYTTQTVNADASFSYEIKKTVTHDLAAGQYFVVVQHPMQNNLFDVLPVTSTGSTAGLTGVLGSTNAWVVNRQSMATSGNLGSGDLANATRLFKISGANSLQGSDAAEALVEGITDANVDDTYTKLQFLIEVPAITINPVGDKHVGDKFTITASTNLAVGDQILVQVYSSSFKPTDKTQSGEFSGATGTVAVAQGTGGLNTISFDVDASTFKPDEYIVEEDAVLQKATGTALFNVLEGAAPTVAPTAVVTTAAPVVVPTTIVATTAPTPVPTTKSPGYGALIALIGLGAVAFIVVRRH